MSDRDFDVLMAEVSKAPMIPGEPRRTIEAATKAPRQRLNMQRVDAIAEMVLPTIINIAITKDFTAVQLDLAAKAVAIFAYNVGQAMERRRIKLSSGQQRNEKKK